MLDSSLGIFVFGSAVVSKYGIELGGRGQWSEYWRRVGAEDLGFGTIQGLDI